jgi:hypothetical protein
MHGRGVPLLVQSGTGLEVIDRESGPDEDEAEKHHNEPDPQNPGRRHVPHSAASSTW